MPAAPSPDLDRNRGNIASMIDQDASQREVGTYVASENVTAQDLRGAQAPSHTQARLVDLQSLARDWGIAVPAGASNSDLSYIFR